MIILIKSLLSLFNLGLFYFMNRLIPFTNKISIYKILISKIKNNISLNFSILLEPFD